MKSITRYPILSDAEKNLPLYVATVGCNVPQHGIYRKNGLDEYQLMFCKEGSGKVILNGEVRELNYGDALFINKNTTHNYKNTTEEWITDWITYDGICVPYISKLDTGIYRFDNFDEIVSVMESVAGTRYGFKWSETTSVLLYKLLLLCNTTTSTVNTAIIRLKPAVKFIEQNYYRDLQLDEIAETVNVSKEHLCTLFQSAFAMRPFEYVTKIRIQKAKELLAAKSDLSLSDIGKICGFNSPAYFTLKFKQLENITPSQFRKKN